MAAMLWVAHRLVAIEVSEERTFVAPPPIGPWKLAREADNGSAVVSCSLLWYPRAAVMHERGAE